MTDLTVASVVDAILSAFNNGMNISTRIRSRRSRKQSKPSRMTEEELKLHDSLTNRPKEIKSEYASSIVKYGKRFEQGDSTAYSSLAHTLLVLNTGLINLINSALSSGKPDRLKSQQSLLLLSECAAADTMQALNQLDGRLSRSVISFHPVPKPRSMESMTQLTRYESPDKSGQQKRPPLSPLLARGGWIRSKSGSSIVTVATAKKRTGEHHRSKSMPIRPPVRQVPAGDMDKPAAPSKPITSKTQTCVCQTSNRHEEVSMIMSNELSPPSYNERPASMLLVRADYFDEQRIQQAETVSPPNPPKIPLHIRQNARSKQRPPSTATFMTASTRIGEIPEHKWRDQVLTEEEREELPLPYVIPPPLEPMKRKGRGFKLWKRTEGRKA